MGSGLKTKQLRVGGMTCVNCENKIEKKLRNTPGVKKAEVSYSAGTVLLTYDAGIVSLGNITAIIEELDYRVLTGDARRKFDISRVIGLMIIIVALYALLEKFGLLNMLAPSQLADERMGYGMLFVIGLVTSVHCIAMCGGINLSQCIPRGSEIEGGRLSAFLPAFMYNAGRVVSYTAVGFAVGALGSAITFSNAMQGVLKLVAGVFMIIMGINMFDIFPWLRGLNPRIPKIFAKKINEEKGQSKSPLIVGLLNGFMPCGPLQAMQIYALSTGNPFTGALSMFLFSIGTVPLMFGLGAISSLMGKKFTSKAMTAGAVLVVVLGLSMLSQGLSLSGYGDVFAGLTPGSRAETQSGSGIVMENGVQIVSSTLSAWSYPAITVQAGTPVKWTIDAPQGSINGCNNRIFIREYGIEYTFSPGENIIEFIPENAGTFSYACWMGMIRSNITVVEAGTEIAAASFSPDNAAQNFNLPMPAYVEIPADTFAIAEIVEEGRSKYQTVTIDLTDEGFSPAVAVVQSAMQTMLIINNTSSRGSNYTLLVPGYNKKVSLDYYENPLNIFPTESFDFSNEDNTSYGYVKVADDLNEISIDEIKTEVENYQTMIWPPETFRSGDSGGGESNP